MKRDYFDVHDKIVVVTGGLGQLGYQFSKALLESGARVAIFDLIASGSSPKEKFKGDWIDDNLMIVPVNITIRKSIEDGLNKIISNWGVPFGLINNAAIDSPPNSPPEENGPFETYPEDSWDKVMTVNSKGVFLTCQVIGAQMANIGRGSIINICSTYGLVGPDQRIYEYRRKADETFYKPVAYSASKSSLLNLTRYLASYWGEKNVRVNTITFGGVFNHQDEKFLEGYCSRVPLRRMAREDEYNGAIIFLISEASSYMTGANLILDGGWTAW